MHRRTLLAAGSLAALSRIGPARAPPPGGPAPELKIGQTPAYSGPAAWARRRTRRCRST